MMIRTTDLLALAQAAIKFAQAASDVTLSKKQLTDAYFSWRVDAGVHEMIARDDENWRLMMAATDSEYMALQAAKGRKRRAEKKLVALAGGVGAQ